MIEYQRIFWSGQYLAPDSGDPGIDPDSGHLEGEVTFTPVWDASVYGLLSDSQRSTYVKPFPFEVTGGELMSDDDGEMVPGVKVPASIGGHPVNWVARFNLSAGGDPITVRELRFASNPGGEVHLHNVIPSDAIYPQLPQDIVKGDSVTDIYTQGQYVVFIVGEPPRTTQHVLAFPGTDEAVAAAEAAVLDMESLRDAAEAHITQVRSDAEEHIGQVRTDTLVTINAAGVQASESRDDALSYRNAAEGHAQTATDAAAAALGSEEAAGASETAAKTSEGNARTSEIEAGLSADRSATSAGQSSDHADRAEQAATAASSSASAADASAGDASASASAAASSAQDASGSASASAGSAQDASSSASAASGSASDAAGSASDAAGSAQDASSSATVASDGAQTVTDNLDAIEAAPGAAQAAQDARDAAAGSATAAAGSAAAAASSASDAASSASAAAGSETAAGQSATDAASSATAAEGHAGDAATALSGAESARDLAQQAQQGAGDERVVAQDAAVLAEGHAQAADGHRVDAEAAAALAQSLRWVVKGAWSPGQYEAGDVVVYDERAYYAQTATSVEPPAQPWVPLTPAGGGGASHWDDLDGKPVVFPPEAHGHDAEDVSGAATPLLDVTEASVGAQSVGEALDATAEASRLEGALTDQVDASDAMVAMPSVGDPMSLASAVDATYLAAVTALGRLEDKADAEHTHDGADITGALTNQVNASEAMVEYNPGFDAETLTIGLAEAVSDAAYLGNAAYQSMIGQVIPALEALGPIFDGKADTDHTHDGADISGALTDQVDASEAMIGVDVWGAQEELTLSDVGMYAVMAMALMDSKADANHTHAIEDVDGLQAALDDRESLVWTDGEGAFGIGTTDVGVKGLALGSSPEDGVPAASAGDFGTAIGPASSTGQSATAVGAMASADELSAAVGPAASAGAAATAIGLQASAGDYSTAIGQSASASNLGTAIGASSSAAGYGSMAIGLEASTSNAGEIALGSSSAHVQVAGSLNVDGPLTTGGTPLIQLVTDFPASPTPGVLYLKAE